MHVDSRSALHPAFRRDLAAAPLASHEEQVALHRRIHPARLALWEALLACLSRPARRAWREHFAEAAPTLAFMRPADLAAADADDDGLVSLADLLLGGKVPDPASAAKDLGAGWAFLAPHARQADLFALDTARASLGRYRAALHAFEVPHLRLVVLNAQHLHRNPRAATSLHLSDLVAAGYDGLRVAALRWDAGRGLRFSTYAQWWIRHAIGRYIDNAGSEIRVSVGILEIVKRVEVAARKCATLGDASPAAVAAMVNLPVKRVAAVVKLSRPAMAPASLDAPLRVPDGTDGDRTLGDCVADEAPPADEVIARGERERALADMLASLPADEREILERRHGLGGREPETLRAIGEGRGLSRERIRQIESRAILAMRDRARRTCPDMLAAAP